VRENVTMSSLRALSNYGYIDVQQEVNTVSQFKDSLRIKTPSIEQRVKNLSGGNQQKVVLAKWLSTHCDLLIFDEPTRGIDVGAKDEIHKLMRSLTDAGKSIIMISSEMPELLGMSDRIVVMHEGRLVATVDKLLNVLRQVSIVGIASVGMTFVMLTGEIDLSVGSIIGLVGIVTAMTMTAGYHPVVAVILGLISGTLMGMLNGFIINKFEIPPLIVTLGMLTTLRGVAFLLTGGTPVFGFTEAYTVIIAVAFDVYNQRRRAAAADLPTAHLAAPATEKA
jgi:hypothetical protein